MIPWQDNPIGHYPHHHHDNPIGHYPHHHHDAGPSGGGGSSFGFVIARGATPADPCPAHPWHHPAADCPLPSVASMVARLQACFPAAPLHSNCGHRHPPGSPCTCHHCGLAWHEPEECGNLGAPVVVFPPPLLCGPRPAKPARRRERGVDLSRQWMVWLAGVYVVLSFTAPQVAFWVGVALAGVLLRRRPD